MNCNRRQFIERSGRIVVAGVAAAWFSSLLQSCAPAKNLQSEVKDNMLTLDPAHLPAGSFVTVNAAGLQAPVYVGRSANNEYSAVLMLCTHKACALEASGAYLICPCHGSEFSAKGKVLKDPADTDLKIYRVTSDDKHVYVHLQ